MKRNKRWFVGLTLFALTLVAAQCGGTAPQPAPNKSTVVAEEAKPTSDVKEEAKPTEDLNATPVVSDTSKVSDESVLGGTFTTDEMDVSQKRTHPGGTYHAVALSDAVSFHPYTTEDATSGTYQGLVYAGALLNVNEDTLELEPYMAEKYEISKDGLTFTFYLRKGLQWSDGQPLTARDYKWTYDQMMDPKNEFAYLSQYEFVTSYEALDDYTIQAKIKEIHAPALATIGNFITPLPKHIWEKLPWNDPEKNPEINHPTVVSGPYKLVEWKRDQYAKFEANDKYWYHGAPNLTNYVIEIVSDQNVAYQKLKNGDIDTGSLTPPQIQEAKEWDNVTVNEWWPVASAWSYIGLNMREGFPTHDINVRHGLSYAVDKNLLSEKIWVGGLAKPLCGIYPPTSWAYNPDVPCYDYSKEKAFEAFGKAGYTLKEDKLVDKDGKQLKLRFFYGPETSPTSKKLALTIQDFLKEVGIDVEIKGMEWNTFLEAMQANEPEWDIYLGGWQSTLEPHGQSTVWAQENIPTLNSVSYINPKMEELFKKAAATYDVPVRKKFYGEIQQMISEDSPYVFLAYRKSAAAVNKRILGIDPKVVGIGWNQEDWYVEP